MTFWPRRAGGVGSSPRVRGKPTAPPHPSSPCGLIPARAGKTTSVPRMATMGQAHPRACGENLSPRSPASLRAGSSPRVRGKQLGAVHVAPRPGLIPARAGKTARGLRRTDQRTAHPRACGENPTPHTGAHHVTGSSPRVRGKRASRPSAPDPKGLIPARAGKTGPVSGCVLRAAAHPRACGENELRPRGGLRGEGSSPRVRGKPSATMRTDRIAGLIPARAGKTRLSPSMRSAARAHPRACGENPNR